MTRKQFIRQGALFSGFALLPTSEYLNYRPLTGNLSLHVFSKHLQFLNYRDMANAAAEIGFDGVDLTVRKGGHVPPEKVEDELPKAVEAIQAAGLLSDMMATNVTSAENEIDQRVLKTAGPLGLKYYRLGYLSFDDEWSIPDRLTQLNLQMKQLAKLNKQFGLVGAYQNHAGKRVGAQIWDIWHLLADLDPDVMGCQYDIRHAIVEGGNSWETGLKLIRPKINCIVLKDFIWKQIDGKWKIHNVPLGEGMVDFDAYFKLLKMYQIEVPVSIHFEYDLGGAEHGSRNISKAVQAEVIKAMKRDVEFARTKWKNA